MTKAHSNKNRINPVRRLLPLLLAVGSCGIAAAQETRWQPYGELTAGVSVSPRLGMKAMPVYGATVGLRHDDLSVGLRYRYTDRSPLCEAEPLHDVSVMLQRNVDLAPRLELFGGVATGFAIQHSQQFYDKPLSTQSTLALSTEVNLGIRYYIAENVALTFNVGAGMRLTGDDWHNLTKLLPDSPAYLTSSGGLTIGIPPRVKKVNLPSQLIVEGTAPILTAYND